MARFTKDVKVVNHLDGSIHEWELCEPFSYRIVNEYDSEVANVPPGFTTDFASIPRPLWWWVAPWGRHGRAAIIHDFLYQRGAITDVARQSMWRPSRLESDRIFREAMAVLDRVLLGRSRWGRLPRPFLTLRLFVAAIRRWLMWLAVVVFGHWAYDRKQAEGTSPELEHRMLVSIAEAMESGEIDLTEEPAHQTSG
ncbi:MAG: DUF1353 domain-containing protein [Acidimicrobiales bacterium]|nr:DUF1353 domain-containing protein [Acidimicrobiales bacterium]